MATPSIREVVEYLCAWGDAGTLAGLSDGQLLDRFVNQREEAAFAALLRRHGPMVLHVCRRVLGRIQDAEDVFQAAFLLLARKGGMIRKRDAVGSWLHGVAYRLAVRAKAQARRRQAHEHQAASLRRAEPTLEAAWSEVQAVLDEELRCLPAKYRAVLVLCYLEGQTQEEAARHLGCPLGTVRSRLARARSLFQKRLVRRGLALSGAALASDLLGQAASGTVSSELSRHTLKAALAFVAGGPALESEICAQVVLLAEGGLKAMSAAKLKLALMMTLAIVALSAGAGALAVHVWADKIVQAKQESGPQAVAQKPVAPKPAEDQVARTARDGDALPSGAIRRLGTLRFRHDHGTSWWMPTAFSRDGKWLATCDGSIRLWNLATGELFREIEGHFKEGLFSPDGKVLATVDFYVAWDQQALCLLDVATGKILHRLPQNCGNMIRVLAFSPDGKQFVSPADGRNSVRLWDTKTGKPVSVLRGPGSSFVHSAVFTADGRTLVTACYGNRVCRWDVARRELRKSFDLPLPEGRVACLSPDGATLAVAPPRLDSKPGEGDTLWDTETGRQRCTLPSGRSKHDNGLAFSPDGKILATESTEAETDGVTISLWDVGTVQRTKRFKVPSRAAWHLMFAPDGKTLLTSSPEPLVRLWDTATGKQLFEETGHTGTVTALSFTPDGRSLISGADDGTLRVWDIAAARLRRPLTGHRWGVHALAIAPDGKTVLSGGADGCLRLHDLDTGEERRRFVIDKQTQEQRQLAYHVLSLGLATDGRTAASWSATGRRERALFDVWDLATGEALVRRADSSGFGLRIFSPDAKLVLSCIGTDPAGAGGMVDSMSSSGAPQPSGPATVVLRDVTKGRQFLPLPQPDSYGYVQAFAPYGRTLVTATGKLRGFEAFTSDKHTLHLWELATGKERLTIAPGKTGWEYRFEHVAFAPDGRTLATVRGDKTIQLWDLATGAELLSRTGCSARVNCLVFSPDSRVLASGHTDSTILLWDATSGGHAPRPVEKSNAGQVERWWSDLAAEDARKAHAAIWGLCAVPERAVNLFRARLRPASAVPADKIKQRIADLDSDEFSRREAASAELAALGDQVQAALQAALQGNPSVELRQRVEALLVDPGRVRSAETLRHLRAVEVLERIGSSETRQILKTIAQGAPGARQTREAKAALALLSRP